MTDGPRPCPRCGSALASRGGGRHELLVCRTCGGLFARGVRPDGVSGTLQGPSLEEARAAASAAMLVRDETAPGVACPECRGRLSRYRIEETDVELDACEPHGVWFDRDELPKLERFVHASPARAGRASPGGARLKVALVSTGAAGVAVVSAVAASSASPGGGVGSALAEAAGEAAVDLVLEGIGELLSGIFS